MAEVNKTSVTLRMANGGAAASVHGSGATPLPSPPVPTAQPGMAYKWPEIWQVATATGYGAKRATAKL